MGNMKNRAMRLVGYMKSLEKKIKFIATQSPIDNVKRIANASAWEQKLQYSSYHSCN